MRKISHHSFSIVTLFFLAQCNLISQSKIINTFKKSFLDNSFSPKRILNAEDTSKECSTKDCVISDSLYNQDSLDYIIHLHSDSKIMIEMTVGESKTELQIIFNASPAIDIETNIGIPIQESLHQETFPTFYGSPWDTTITFSSAVATQELYIEIENKSTEQSIIRISIKENASSISVIGMVAAGVAVVLIIILCGVYWVYRKKKLLRMRMRFQAMSAEQESANYQLAASQLVNHQLEDASNDFLSEQNFDGRFPETEYECFQNPFQEKTCTICMEDFKQNEKCRQLYCEHIFHSVCVKRWLLSQMKKQEKSFCPNCYENMTFLVLKPNKETYIKEKCLNQNLELSNLSSNLPNRI